MAVVAPNTRIGMRLPVVELDGHGTPVTSGHGPARDPRPARVVSEPGSDNDLETGPGLWVLAVDPEFWPLPAGAQLVEDGGAGRVWTVTSAAHRPSDFDPDIAYVRAEASLSVS
ncbi:hypothetical protein ACQP10_38000 (plasmid) [Streptosporangium sandarakinum]|uniref:hypothetical protein n=1 Tax=Streptosporangium sandarakinum TaxID=1260955 RepID=UPI003D8FF801